MKGLHRGPQNLVNNPHRRQKTDIYPFGGAENAGVEYAGVDSIANDELSIQGGPKK